MQKHATHEISQSVSRKTLVKRLFLWGGFIGVLGVAGIIISYAGFTTVYNDKVYPNVFVGSVWFGGQTQENVLAYWQLKNTPFENVSFEFRSEDLVATVSGTELSLGYDAQLAAVQAYEVGRTGNFLRDFKTKFLEKSININPLFRYKTDVIEDVFDTFSQSLDTPAQDALFTFQDGKVVAFKPSQNGKKVNREEARKMFQRAAESLSIAPVTLKTVVIPIDAVEPLITTDKVNGFGIKEHIATGYSEFSGSIPGRIHNVALAASRFHGVLIPPGETLSFNKTLGDVSASTGYQPAYIIKGGRTVLGDGGGVCQVSTTLFRAAMNAGLPILERHAHAYRVHYYEEGGFKAGLDATVFDPTVDLKIKNDTPGYILIQTKADTDKLTLQFDLYGQSDGRKSEISNHQVWGITPPPQALYQDDPTLPVGVVKQVDFAAWGAKASFKYKVTRGNEILQDTIFSSNYRSWQAVFLKGTKT